MLTRRNLSLAVGVSIMAATLAPTGVAAPTGTQSSAPATSAYAVGSSNLSSNEGDKENTCGATIAAIAVPVAAILGVNTAAQLHIPAVDQAVAQLNAQLADANDRVQHGLGIANDDASQWAREINAQLARIGAAGADVGQALGAVAAIAGGIGAIAAIVEHCAPDTPPTPVTTTATATTTATQPPVTTTVTKEPVTTTATATETTTATVTKEPLNPPKPPLIVREVETVTATETATVTNTATATKTQTVTPKPKTSVVTTTVTPKPVTVTSTATETETATTTVTEEPYNPPKPPLIVRDTVTETVTTTVTKEPMTRDGFPAGQE